MRPALLWYQNQTKDFIRKLKLQTINPHDHSHSVVSLLNWVPSIPKGPVIFPQITCGCGFAFPVCRTSASTIIWGLTEFVFIGMESMQHFILPGDPVHREGGAGMGPWPWDPLITAFTTPSRSRQPYRALEWPTEGTTEAPIWRQYSVNMGCQFNHWNQRPNMRLCSHGKNTRSRNKGIEVGGAPLTVISKDPLEDCVLPVSRTVGSAELEVQVPRGSTLFLEDISRVPLNYSLYLLPGHLDSLYPGTSRWLRLLSGFCRDQTGELNEHIIGTTCISFRSLMVIQIYDIPTRLQYFCFLNSFFKI